MKKEIKLYQTEKGIEVEIGGECVATIPMAIPTQPEDDVTKPVVYDFTLPPEHYITQITSSRLVEPTEMWAIPQGVAENGNSIHMPTNNIIRDDILNLIVRQQAAKHGNVEKPYTTGYIYTKKVFGLGRVDIEANLTYAKDVKNTIWLTTSPFRSKECPNLFQLIEGDVVEYTGADTGEYNTSRGMWLWQENQQSVSEEKLPHIDFVNKSSLSGGSWWWDKSKNGWYQWTLYPVCRNGNRLRGTNGKYYFVTNPERGKVINSADLEWIREDGVIGKGLDGNKYFTAQSTDAIGGGAVKTQFLDGETKIAGWHKWSIIMDNHYISYLCDDKEYWRSPEPLSLPMGLTYNLIFSTAHVGSSYTGEHAMQIKSITYTPL